LSTASAQRYPQVLGTEAKSPDLASQRWAKRLPDFFVRNVSRSVFNIRVSAPGRKRRPRADIKLV